MRGSKLLVTHLLSMCLKFEIPKGQAGTSPSTSRKALTLVWFVIRVGLLSAFLLSTGVGCSSLSEAGTTLSGRIQLQRPAGGGWSGGLELSWPKLPQATKLPPGGSGV